MLSTVVLQQILISDSFVIVKTPTLMQVARESVWHLRTTLFNFTNNFQTLKPWIQSSLPPIPTPKLLQSNLLQYMLFNSKGNLFSKAQACKCPCNVFH